MMDRKLLAAILAVVVCVLTTVASAQDKSSSVVDDLRTEIRELKRMMLDLSDRLDALERRLSQFEQERRPFLKTFQPRSPGRRRLGSYTVDENGIIWDGDFPIGIWGVWGDQEAGGSERVHR
jgi:hypothetical protein